jgi:hypothetical protein
MVTLKYSEEEDPDDYPFPLTLRSPKKPLSPYDAIGNGGAVHAVNGNMRST